MPSDRSPCRVSFWKVEGVGNSILTIKPLRRNSKLQAKNSHREEVAAQAERVEARTALLKAGPTAGAQGPVGGWVRATRKEAKSLRLCTSTTRPLQLSG